MGFGHRTLLGIPRQNELGTDFQLCLRVSGPCLPLALMGLVLQESLGVMEQDPMALGAVCYLLVMS